MKNSIDTIGNRTRDLQACSAVPVLRPRMPPNIMVQTNKYGDGNNKITSKMDRVTSEYYILSRGDILFAN